MARLTAWEPTRERPWDRRLARHLLERAGFGGPPAAVATAVEQGPDAAVDGLLAGLAAPADAQPAFLNAVPAGDTKQARQQQLRAQTVELKGWWLDQLLHSPAPAREKLTLFWHGHFTSEAHKVKSARLLFDQHQLFKTRGAGRFGDLCLAIARDPAMLIYLDNAQNVARHPNENFARELFELFGLGIGHYTEEDIHDSARAFTGWSLARRGPKRGGSAEFAFHPGQHDDGPKTVLGARGRLDGGDVIRAMTAQPACARWLAGKLWRFYVADTLGPDDESDVAALADELRAHDLALAPTLRALFRSAAFYRPDRLGGHLKSPVELVVGTLRGLGLTTDARTRPRLVQALAGLGQELFDPPNVAGWPGGRAWINTSLLFARYNLCGALLGVGGRRGGALPAGLPARNPEQLVESACERLLVVPLAQGQRDALTNYARAAWQSDGAEAATRAVLHLVMSTPQYQLC